MKALILSYIHIDFQYEYAIRPVKEDYTGIGIIDKNISIW